MLTPAFCLSLALAAAPAAQPPRSEPTPLERFQTLLKELRALQTAAAREEAAWRLERQNLRRLAALARQEADETQDEVEKLQAEARALDADLAAARRACAQRRAETDALRAALARAADRLAASPGEGREEAKRRAARLRAGADASDAAAELWTLALQRLSWAGQVETRRTQIRAGGGDRDVWLLRLGAAARFAVSPDGRRAWRWSRGAAAWRPLSEAQAREVRRAVHVARKQRPAELAILPVAPVPHREANR